MSSELAGGEMRGALVARLSPAFGRAMSARASLIAAVTGTTLLTGSAFAQGIALTNANLIDGSGAAMQPGVTIVIEGGRIVDMGPSVRAPAGSSVIDLTGKYVVPGIINGHGHVGPAPRDPQLRQYARYGVTTTTSMSFDQDDIQQFKAAQKAGDLRGARILTVMYRFMSEPFNPGSEAKTPEDARANVDEIVAKGADMIKVWVDAQGGRYPKLTPEFTAAVMDQATRHNKIKMAHIVELEDARRIVDQGVNILAHDVRDQDIPDDFVATLKGKKVAVISTLAREEAMFAFGDRAEGPAFIDDPLFRSALPPARLAVLRTTKHAEQAADPMRSTYQRMFETDKRNVKKLLDADVHLGFGTDSGGELNRFFLQGWFEHRQMELLRDAGLSPMQIIETFSKNNSEILGIDKDFGTLATGKAADLLVLTRNPLDDITNMRALDTVYLGGKKFE
jgi:imidazolonepropionase-like amidohydrolase